MALTAGTRIGPYEITASIGAGGMGEVYRARDAKLNRDVAIKVLPALFAGDVDRLARFTREAQALAALNHPNIATIYGVEESEGVRALAMELVEGDDLSAVIARGAMPMAEALPIARQIALALEAAHGQGIIHRDLKPANIKLRPDGTIKVLDFGLAKALAPEAASAPASGTALPTVTTPAMTEAGMILGTAAYMSPEQAKGRPADRRADVWAFGCVLFEMLTGTRAFEGADVSDTLAGILRGEPEWTALPAGLSPTIRVYLRRCLTKDPNQRVHDIADVRLALDGAFDVPAPAAAAPPAVAPKRRGRVVGVVLAAAVVAAALAGFGTWASLRPDPPAVMWLTASPEQESLLVPFTGDQDIAVSPDGRRIVYATFENGVPQLYVRSIDSLKPLRITGLTAPRNPFFSSDGAWIGFFDGNSLRKVASSGGPALVVCPITGTPRGASWLDDTIIFATSDQTTGLLRVSARGGTPEVLTKPDSALSDDQYPEIVPGGGAVLFSTISAGGAAESRIGNAQIQALDLSTGKKKLVLQGGSNPRYAASGHIVYGYLGTLRAVAFDVDRLETRGDPVPIVEGVITKPTGAADFSVTRTGSLVYLSGEPVNADRILVWVDRAGKETVLAGAPTRAYVYPRISPNGRLVALDIRDQDSDIWTWDLERRTLTRLTFDPGANRGVAWTPDGRRLAFSAERDGKEGLYWQAADGTGAAEPLTSAETARPRVPYDFSPDGSRLVFGEPGAPPFDLFSLRLDEGRKVEPLLTAAYSEHNGAISPDGRWLAYQSDESSAAQVYVRPFPNVSGAGRWQVSTSGGTRPAWARNGRELFYLVPPGTIMSVPVETTGTFTAGAPVKLFDGPYYNVLTGRTYDVTADGQRFLMIKNAPTAAQARPPQVVVVLNWFEELKRRVVVK